MIGDVIFMILLKELIGLEIRIHSIIYANMQFPLYWNYNNLECHSHVLYKEKYIKELLEDKV